MMQQMGDILKIFQLKSTGPRRRLLWQLYVCEHFVDAETLWLKLKEQGEQISFATTYFNLNLFCKCGLADRKSDANRKDVFKISNTELEPLLLSKE